MNFIPEFVQVLSSVPNPQYEKMDMKFQLDYILDEVEEKSKKKRKVSLSNCWTNFSDWNKRQVPLLVISNRPKYLLPKTTSIYPNYNGPLLEIQADSLSYLKPSSLVRSGLQDVKAKELKHNDKLDNLIGEQIIQKIEQIIWKGNLFSLSFQVPVYLPIRYDGEYILIPC